jgi:hypothetical protein
MLLWLLIALAALAFLLPKLKRLDAAQRQRLWWTLIGVVLVLSLVYARQLGLAAILAALLAVLPRLIQLAGYAGLLSRMLGIDLRGTVLQSVLRSPFIELNLDPRGGPVAGQVRAGPFSGRRLETLSEEELRKLRELLMAEDSKGRYLLDAWLWHRRQAASGAGAGGEYAGGGAGSGKRGGTGMTREEALAILGLEAGATKEQVIEAHRRLVQRLHPDRGGSDYLAGLLNEARRVLAG